MDWVPTCPTDVQEGHTLDVVCTSVGIMDSLVIQNCCWHGVAFLVEGWKGCATGHHTVYSLERTGLKNGRPCFRFREDTVVFDHLAHLPISFRTLIDVCSGMGGVSIGAQAAQIQTALFVDKNELACRAVQQGGGRVLKADVLDRQDRIKVHKACPKHSFLLSAGFPCQPYSRQGSAKALEDKRSEVLGGVLQLAWFTQCSGLILECVSEVASHEEVMKAIQLYAAKLGHQLQATTLELADQWASRRCRWWALALPSCQVQVKLPTWPRALNFRTVEEVVPEWPLWPLEEEKALEWSSREIAAFHDPELGADCRVLDVKRPAPTALHSYGNPLDACPCGCRAQGLSENRLKKDGLRGYCIHSGVTGQARHIHPQELALLNAIPVSHAFLPDTKAALCLIGQIASPLQSLWVFMHVAEWAAAVFGQRQPPSALQVLDTFKKCLLQERNDRWVLPSMFESRSFILQDQQGTFSMRTRGPIRAVEVIEAEARLQGRAPIGKIDSAGRILDPQALLHSNAGPLTVLFCTSAKDLDHDFRQAECTTEQGDSGVTQAGGSVVHHGPLQGAQQAGEVAAPRSSAARQVIEARQVSKLDDKPHAQIQAVHEARQVLGSEVKQHAQTQAVRENSEVQEQGAQATCKTQEPEPSQVLPGANVALKPGSATGNGGPAEASTHVEDIPADAQANAQAGEVQQAQQIAGAQVNASQVGAGQVPRLQKVAQAKVANKQEGRTESMSSHCGSSRA